MKSVFSSHAFAWVMKFMDNLPSDFDITDEERDEAYARYRRGQDPWQAAADISEARDQ